jgi:hypothetical protein
MPHSFLRGGQKVRGRPRGRGGGAEWRPFFTLGYPAGEDLANFFTNDVKELDGVRGYSQHCPPKLNPEKDAKEWLSKDKGPHQKRMAARLGDRERAATSSQLEPATHRVTQPPLAQRRVNSRHSGIFSPLSP